MRVSLRMAWPTSHCDCGFSPAEWTETRHRPQRRSRWIVSCFLFISQKMRGGVYLLAHQAGPGLHDLPLVPRDPESEEEEGMNKDLWSVFYCLRVTIDVTHNK